MSEVVGRSVKVTGRVQGVFFRDACRSEAEARQVSGWVSNEADGSVAAWFEGPADAVDALVDWCRAGPPRARVSELHASAVEPTGLSTFEVR